MRGAVCTGRATSVSKNVLNPKNYKAYGRHH